MKKSKQDIEAFLRTPEGAKLASSLGGADKEKLLNALVPIMYTVSGKNTNSFTEGILINCGDNNICTLTTSDFEKGMRTEIECEIIERGKCVINANKLFQIIKCWRPELFKF